MRRDELQKWSQIATAKTKPAPDAPLRIRDLPGVRKLEDQLLLYSSNQPLVDDAVARLSRQLFGIVSADTEFELPAEYWDLPDYSPEKFRIVKQYNDHERQYETSDNLTDDENMQEMAGLGIDFSDERGQPLRCTKHLCRAAEAAAKGIKGKLPDRGTAALTRWEDKLRRESEAFKAKKRKG